MISARHRSNETSRRLDKAPGIGPVLATALVATVADPRTFRTGRNFSAWIGLVPNACFHTGPSATAGIEGVPSTVNSPTVFRSSP